MSLRCEFKEDTLCFNSNKFNCSIITRDEEGCSYRSKGNLTEFYENLKNKASCTINFDNNNKIMTISYPEYCYDLYPRENVKFEINGVVVIVPYDSCFEAIRDFLKQFQFSI